MLTYSCFVPWLDGINIAAEPLTTRIVTSLLAPKAHLLNSFICWLDVIVVPAEPQTPGDCAVFAGIKDALFLKISQKNLAGVLDANDALPVDVTCACL